MRITRHKIYISERVVDLPFVRCIRIVSMSMSSRLSSFSLVVHAVQFLFAINTASWLILGEQLLLAVVVFVIFYSIDRHHPYRSAVRMQLFCLSKYNFQRVFFLLYYFVGLKCEPRLTDASLFFLFIYLFSILCCCPDFHVIFFLLESLWLPRVYFD